MSYDVKNSGAPSRTVGNSRCNGDTKEMIIDTFRNSDFIAALVDQIEASNQWYSEASKLQSRIVLRSSSRDEDNRKASVACSQGMLSAEESVLSVEENLRLGYDHDKKDNGLLPRIDSNDLLIDSNGLRFCGGVGEFSDHPHMDNIQLRFSAEIGNEPPDPNFDASYEGGSLYFRSDGGDEDDDAKSDVSYVDKDGDRIVFSVANGDLFMSVNGERQAGQNDSSGIVTALTYVPGQPADVRTQYGWGGSDMPLVVVRKLRRMAESVGVKHNLPDLHALSKEGLGSSSSAHLTSTREGTSMYTSKSNITDKRSTRTPTFVNEAQNMRITLSLEERLRERCSSDMSDDSVNLLEAKDKFKRKHRRLHTGSGVFVDIDEMKLNVRRALLLDEENRPHIKETGLFQCIVRNKWFECVALALIPLNAVWVALDTDLMNTNESKHVKAFRLGVDSAFGLIFLVEWILRLFAYETTCDAFREQWFVMDTIITALMIVDLAVAFTTDATSNWNTSALKMLRTLRLSRILRISRVLREFPEIAVLIKGIGAAAKSVFCTLCLLAILLFIFSLVFRQLTDGSYVGGLYFKSVPYGMYSLLLYGTLPDMAAMVDTITAEHFLLGALMLFFILCASLTVMNMLVGVLVEVVSCVSSMEKEEKKVWSVKAKLEVLLLGLGVDVEDLWITRKDFNLLIQNPAAAKAIEEVGVDPIALIDYADTIFSDSQHGISFPGLIEVLLQLRGSNLCTVKDIIDLRKYLFQELSRTEKALKHQNSYLKKLASDSKVGESPSASVSRMTERLTFAANASIESDVKSYKSRANCLFGDVFSSKSVKTPGKEITRSNKRKSTFQKFNNRTSRWG